MNNQFELKVNRISSLFTQRHAHIVYGLIRWLGITTALEVGSYCGYMTTWLAKGIFDNGGVGVHAIDNFSLHNRTPTQLHNTLLEFDLANLVNIHDVDSQKLEEFPSCQLAFIDGDHSLMGVTHDVNLAVAAGAICIIIHDTENWWGPRDFVNQGGPHGPWQRLRAPHDSGLTIYLKDLGGSEQPQYSEKDYPSGAAE